ncbi:[FeFe] hydrogenase H-cluster maturation GTPase HydF [Parvibacter caecicola]|uniref:[FeFe] hydrogenase H-cluster maturation GTPase HydF n=1 Tax=Parvibacter caecicola TaxID=747645 RepID=UPI0023F463B3|nr:[FeFe] hydrogenase H-cluster maturation GTPase HydF [Parvibacter caecicola]
MSLNETPSGERPHIVFFGVRNAGKSSLVNAVTGQALAVVSPVAGTTTDPVRKAMELAPAGPVLVVDTPGIDDTGAVGELRVRQALRALDQADVAVLVVDAGRGMTPFDHQLRQAFQEKGVPYVVAWNKADVAGGPASAPPLEGAGSGPTARAEEGDAQIRVSALTGEGVRQLKELLAATIVVGGAKGAAGPGNPLVADLLTPGDVVVLVIPLDSAAPKGRLILPQQQVMRDVLEAGAFPCAAGVEGLPALLDMLPRPPRLVVTDSQAFGAVAAAVPADVLLTSFSILMARYKGGLPAQLTAVRALEALSDGSIVLIAEGCTHHRQCNDIGTVKLPEWIRQIGGANPQFAFTSGREFPDDLSPYAAVVHCGGCMLNRQEMQSRLRRAAAQGVPATNYGMVIARAHGILPRALAPLGIAAP